MTAKHATMILYSDSYDPNCHRVRVVLAEKGTAVNVVYVDEGQELPNDILALSPEDKLPILVDRDLILYEPEIISEYLDERFPHPPLLPVYPVARAKSRLIIKHMEKDWYSLAKIIETAQTEKQRIAAQQEFSLQINNIVGVFTETEYFLSDTFSLADCCFAVLCWRFKRLGIKISDPSLKNYMARMFNRHAFQESLSDAEKEMAYE